MARARRSRAASDPSATGFAFSRSEPNNIPRVIASTPAVVNAVVDAIRHLGINDIQMPCTPERVWRAIQGSKAGGATDTPPAAMPHFEQGATNQDQGAGQ